MSLGQALYELWRNRATFAAEAALTQWRPRRWDALLDCEQAAWDEIATIAAEGPLPR